MSYQKLKRSNAPPATPATVATLEQNQMVAVATPLLHLEGELLHFPNCSSHGQNCSSTVASGNPATAGTVARVATVAGNGLATPENAEHSETKTHQPQGAFWRELLAEIWNWDDTATTPQGSGWLWGVHLQNKHDPELWPTPGGAALSYVQAAPELQRAFAGRQVRAVYLAQTGSR